MEKKLLVILSYDGFSFKYTDGEAEIYRWINQESFEDIAPALREILAEIDPTVIVEEETEC